MNAFESIIGNTQAKSYLSRMVNEGRVGNSLLFAGPEGIGKSLFATAFAKLLFSQQGDAAVHLGKIDSGNHPDFHIYKPEGKTGMHSIDTMRHFCEEVYIAPFESKYKIFVIHEAERMLPTSANALLKTFEEPAQDAIIILLTSSPSQLLPTVLSRCRKIHFQPLQEQEISSLLISKMGTEPNMASKAASFAQGSVGKALQMVQEGEDPLRLKVLNILASDQSYTYKELSAASEEIGKLVEERKKELEAQLRKTLIKGKENLNAAQKVSLEKEVEGAISMRGNQVARALFEMILLWYRDLHLLSITEESSLVVHKDFIESEKRAIKKGKMIPVEEVQGIVSEALLSLERSTSLAICLENLFLKLLL